MHVRPLAPGDRDALEAALRSDSAFRADEVEVALELIDDALADSASDYWVLVAQVEGHVEDQAPVEGHGELETFATPRGGIAGYICYGPTPMTEASYDLYWLVTAARFRGRGVARSLVEAMERDLRGRGGGGVRVETSDTEGYGAARRLYDRLGYPVAGTLPDFYRSGDDLVIYYKRL